MEDKLLDVHVRESYARDVYIRVKVSEDRKNQFKKMLDRFDGMNKNYEEIVDSLSDAGFEITHIDDNDSLFDFEGNHYVELEEVKNND